MDALVRLSEDNVPSRYLADPLPNVDAEYGFRLFTKSLPDEKEIAQVYVKNKPDDIRVGWLIPVLSMVSIEHELADDKYYIKHVFEVLKFLKGQELHESIYVFVYSKRLLNIAGVSFDGELSLSFLPYGLYPYYGCFSKYNCDSRQVIVKSLVINKNFNSDLSVGFFKVLTNAILPVEMNDYARFMFFYQVYEMAMELVFYKKVKELKAKKSHLGLIRKKMEDYSSESKLISVLYSDMGREQIDVDLANVAKYVFDGVKDESYYTGTHRSAMLYDVRNTMVHSYYRYKISDKLSFFSGYIESEVYYILEYLYKDEEMRKEVEFEYFCG